MRRMALPLGRQDKIRRRGVGPREEDAGTCLGHGVGMGQYGALSMAERGICARDILLHYYTDCRLSLLS